MAKDNEENKGKVTDTTKVTILFAGITNVYVNVHGGCMWSSARMGYVVSWYGRVVVVGRSAKVAGVGWVVKIQLDVWYW